MILNRQARIQLIIFTVIALTALTVMGLRYMKLPAKLFGVGHYVVDVELPRTGGLYETANVTYRGSKVGRVQAVRLSDSGVIAELSLQSGIDIPSDLKAEVHSQSAIGEQYVELLPRNATSPPLRNGDVIAMSNTSVPTDINGVLDSVRTGLQAIPRGNLKTVIDESYTAVGGLGAELSAIVDGTATLALDARKNLDPLLALIDDVGPVIASQTQTSQAITAWASQVATVTRQLADQDAAVSGILENGGPALDDTRQLVERLQPTLPILLANLVSVAEVGLVYRDGIEQLLVLLPQLVAIEQGSFLANVNTKQDYIGAYLSFNLNLNLPPTCTTGYLPAQQTRGAALVDYPERAPGELYCRVPQDSPFNVRGARNLPCETRPGKRAATVKLCESDEEYVPLNDGYNWKGDPNATVTGQDIPHMPPGTPPQTPPPPPMAGLLYDPATGGYVGPDGRRYIQSDLAQDAPTEQTWQSMLLPAGS